MRFTLPLLALLLTLAVAGAAYARPTVRPDQPVPVRALRSVVDHYRAVTWTYQRAAHVSRTPTKHLERHTSNRVYLQWAINTWMNRAEVARRVALVRIERKLSVHLPRGPRLHARLARRVSYNRSLALRLRRIYPGTVTRSFASASGRTRSETLRLWQKRSAVAAVGVAEHGVARPPVADWLNNAFTCIHRYEGAWDSNTGNGYFGGLQMDVAFQSLYGAEFLRRWGTADNWPVWAQVGAAARAYQSGRGFSPWPNTARSCGLL